MGRGLMRMKGILPVLAAVTLLTLLQSMAIIMQAKWLAEVISALFAGAPLQEQAGRIGLFAVMFLARYGFDLLQQQIASEYAEQAGADLRRGFMDRLMELGPRFARSSGTGHVVTLVREGIQKYRIYLEKVIPRMPAAGATPALILLYILLQDMMSAVILLIMLPILIVFMILVGLAAKKQMEHQFSAYRALSNHFVDAMRGLETLKLLGRSRGHARAVEQVSGRYRRATMKTLRVAFMSSFALDFFTMLGVAMVAVGLGMRLIHGEIELVTALTVLILAPEYFLPIRMVGADYHATLEGKEAGEAIQAILQQPPLAEAGVSASANRGLQAVCGEKAASWTRRSRLRLSGIGLRHEAEGPASLEDVSLQVEGMRMIGIAGASGAGKSTLIDVLGGFLKPTYGDIAIDGCSGADLLCTKAWRSQIAYIPQAPYLFSASLADNIRFYTPDATDREVEAAVQAVALQELVAELPQGIHTQIGAGGRQLSGGQEHRVALARAFLSGRPVLLLDEPTAHLDIETEYELKQTMLRLFKGRLVFLATHRLHWMPDMDHILIMEQGKLVESGTHAELLDRQGAYYELLRSQWEVVV
ncbi:thiol reductant ABC exporter subunit CydD [Paenibacillus sp. JX-17]|uniref:Thiol reductant ABC exporter subunit CydD n=1 Tax=Paenibacillus lacisoli TaxID=3064525 RepID=A0ABT9CCS8_9BACL|nr:thiol reductant ABC exporter subunit CydD [Paenibacillus sp. JX-17]MDO7906383.1 thiol reductant ABC exporter subunit CydD [Paenibacillus sp. JX-17]